MNDLNKNVPIKLGKNSDFTTQVSLPLNAIVRSKDCITVSIDNKAATRQAIFNQLIMANIIVKNRSVWSSRELPNINSDQELEAKELEREWDYTKIAIHHAGLSYNSSCPDIEQIKQVEEKHINSNHWSDIGYHYAIGGCGTVYECRDIRLKGSHLSNFNSKAIGIVLLTNLSGIGDGVGFSQKATTALIQSWKGWKDIFSIEKIEFFSIDLLYSLVNLIEIITQYFNISELGGHREFPHQNRMCPGDIGIKLVEKLRTVFSLAKPEK